MTDEFEIGPRRVRSADRGRTMLIAGPTVALIVILAAVVAGADRRSVALPSALEASAVSARLISSPTPTPTAGAELEGWWGLNFDLSHLQRPTLGSPGPNLASSLRFELTQVEYGTGQGCEAHRGTYSTDGRSLTIRLELDPPGACSDPVAQVIVARIGTVASYAIERCVPLYAYPTGDAVSSLGACRVLSLYDPAGSLLLVYETDPPG
jgi:hypothetical protein